jgi:hypothetical protein
LSFAAALFLIRCKRLNPPVDLRLRLAIYDLKKTENEMMLPAILDLLQSDSHSFLVTPA